MVSHASRFKLTVDVTNDGVRLRKNPVQPGRQEVGKFVKRSPATACVRVDHFQQRRYLSARVCGCLHARQSTGRQDVEHGFLRLYLGGGLTCRQTDPNWKSVHCVATRFYIPIG